MQSVNEKFEAAMDNEYYVKILYKICNRNLKTVCSKEEIESLVMSTLWKCVRKYNSSKSNAKFSSYLYRSMENNSRRLYKKKISTVKEKQLYEDTFCRSLVKDESSKREVFEILESLKQKNEEYYNVLVQKFFYNMTNQEIGEANGCGKEWARKKIKKALNLCRKIVYK